MMTWLASSGCEDTRVSCSIDIGCTGIVCPGVRSSKLVTTALWLIAYLWAIGIVTWMVVLPSWAVRIHHSSLSDLALFIVHCPKGHDFGYHEVAAVCTACGHFHFSLRVADNGRTSPCGFLVQRLGDFVFSSGLSLRGTLVVSTHDVVLPDCGVPCRGPSVDWHFWSLTPLPDRWMFGVKRWLLWVVRVIIKLSEKHWSPYEAAAIS